MSEGFAGQLAGAQREAVQGDPKGDVTRLAHNVALEVISGVTADT